MPYRFRSKADLLLHKLPSLIPSLIPSSCALCGVEDDNLLCKPCEQRFFTHHPPRCRQCGITVPATDATLPCATCLQEQPDFDATIVATDYVAPADHLILALKFGHRLAIAPLLARLLHDAMLHQTLPSLPDILIPVPLSPQRLADRGFNQALEIARPLSRATGIPLGTRLLERTRDTAMQAQLPLKERHRNMRHAFVPTAEGVLTVNGRHIAVIDDVSTSGSTLNAIAEVLKRHGATRVTNLIVARTPAQ